MTDVQLTAYFPTEEFMTKAFAVLKDIVVNDIECQLEDSNESSCSWTTDNGLGFATASMRPSIISVECNIDKERRFDHAFSWIKKSLRDSGALMIETITDGCSEKEFREEPLLDRNSGDFWIPMSKSVSSLICGAEEYVWEDALKFLSERTGLEVTNVGDTDYITPEREEISFFVKGHLELDDEEQFPETHQQVQ